MILLRVQDAEGRGPYRPGFSHRWADRDGPINPPWWIEIGKSMGDAHAEMVGPYHWGCGFASHDQFNGWFTQAEQRRLCRLGYSLVVLQADKVIAETATQVVFGKTAPLSEVISRYRLGSNASRRAA